MKRILILEDDEALGRRWQLALEEAGFRVVHEVTADAAIEAFDEQPFDLIVADVFIRAADGTYSPRGGLSLLSHVRLQRRTLPPFITVTGSAIPAITSQHAELLGAVTSLRKPVAPAALVQLVNDLLAAAEA